MTAPVRSVSQAFAILRLLAEAGPLILSDVGRAAGLSPSSCLNLLRTLVDEGAVEREGATRRYRLAAPWAAAGLFSDDRATAALDRLRPAMTRLARDHDAAVGLWTVAPGRRLLLVGHAQSDAAMRIQLADGQRQPLGNGAVGRALAAAQQVSDAELARRHREVRWQSALQASDYVSQVREAERNGFAIDQGLAFSGVCSVAAAIPGEEPGLILSASVFSGSLSLDELGELGKAIAGLCGERLTHCAATRLRA